MSKLHPTNERMKYFIETIIDQTRELLNERADDMLAAWQENIEEAQENEKEEVPPLKVSIGATVDIEKNRIETQIKFTAVYQSKIGVTMQDPNQPDIPGLDAATTAKKLVGDLKKKGVTLTIEKK